MYAKIHKNSGMLGPDGGNVTVEVWEEINGVDINIFNDTAEIADDSDESLQAAVDLVISREKARREIQARKASLLQKIQTKDFKTEFNVSPEEKP